MLYRISYLAVVICINSIRDWLNTTDRDNIITIGILVYSIVAFVDAATTTYITRNGYPELNPFLAPFVEYVFALKLISVVLIFYVVWFGSEYLLKEGSNYISNACIITATSIPSIMTLVAIVHNILFIIYMVGG